MKSNIAVIKWLKREAIEDRNRKSDEREMEEERTAETRDQYFAAGC